METPAGRAGIVATLPLLVLGVAIYFSAITFEDVAQKATCIASCACARNYAIGGFVLYLLAIKAAFNSGSARTLPKDEHEATAHLHVTPAEKKLAAKAA
eukprot:CAMPEP_0115850400 /NCGR_PEP_ID=MMETSP0287-20121206/11945_1 /TAXON_ID=412157 /ORGANISM="Chrysochromulina rotalis, Strain UIO044" /LENGTH=98 /DNA_ID=CAMNT_0003304397 /DNA_START=83 /DNA_END=379 /DNA_ORIENTATION=-